MLRELKTVFSQIFNSHIIIQSSGASLIIELSYVIIIYDSAYNTYLHIIKILRNKTIAIIFGAHYHETASFIYAKLEILDFKDV